MVKHRKRIFNSMVAAACAYETLAIFSRAKLPTISSVAHRHPVLGAVVLAGLSHHFQNKAAE